MCAHLLLTFKAEKIQFQHNDEDEKNNHVFDWAKVDFLGGGRVNKIFLR